MKANKSLLAVAICVFGLVGCTLNEEPDEPTVATHTTVIKDHATPPPTVNVVSPPSSSSTTTTVVPTDGGGTSTSTTHTTG